MNLPWDRGGSDRVPVIRVEARPDGSPLDEDTRGTWQRFLQGVGTFWTRYIKGFTFEQIDRVREAKLQHLEGEAATKIEQAKKLAAEAQLIFLQGEKLAREIRRDFGGVTSEPSVDQWNEFRAAIELIHQKGGRVILPSLNEREADDVHELGARREGEEPR